MVGADPNAALLHGLRLFARSLVNDDWIHTSHHRSITLAAGPGDTIDPAQPSIDRLILVFDILCDVADF